MMTKCSFNSPVPMKPWSFDSSHSRKTIKFPRHRARWSRKKGSIDLFWTIPPLPPLYLANRFKLWWQNLHKVRKKISFLHGPYWSTFYDKFRPLMTKSHRKRNNFLNALKNPLAVIQLTSCDSVPQKILKI